MEDAGVRMLDIQSMILAQRVMVLKRFMDKENSSSWKILGSLSNDDGDGNENATKQ